MDFKQIDLGDLDDVMRLGRVMYEESGMLGDFAEDRCRFTATIFIASPNVFSWGAWADRELAGFMAGEVMDHCASDRLIGREHFLYVSPDKRGLFASKGLMKRFEDWCRDRGASSTFMDISSDIDQENVVKLMKIFGYREAGILMEKEIEDA
jgi:GNAT superfamily N-acetyltransferase